MADRLSEQERRELAQAHRDDIEIESATPVAPRRLGQMVSLRLDPDVAIALRDLASERRMSLSDLLREAAARVLAEASTSMQVTDIRLEVSHGSRHTVDFRIPTGSWVRDPSSSNDTQLTAIAA
jgi:hypothetical protein